MNNLHNDSVHSSTNIWQDLPNHPWVVLIGVMASLVAIVAIIPALWNFVGEKAWNQTCYIGAHGADVSISVKGWNASSECQKLITASEDERFYQLDYEPPGDIVCSLDMTKQRGFIITVRDTGFKLIGHFVCNLYVNPIEQQLNSE